MEIKLNLKLRDHTIIKKNICFVAGLRAEQRAGISSYQALFSSN